MPGFITDIEYDTIFMTLRLACLIRLCHISFKGFSQAFIFIADAYFRPAGLFHVRFSVADAVFRFSHIDTGWHRIAISAITFRRCTATSIAFDEHFAAFFSPAAAAFYFQLFTFLLPAFSRSSRYFRHAGYISAASLPILHFLIRQPRQLSPLSFSLMAAIDIRHCHYWLPFSLNRINSHIFFDIETAIADSFRVYAAHDISRCSAPPAAVYAAAW